MALPIAYSFRSLVIRWKSTLLAMIGIGLVVAVFVGLLSMASGFRLALRALLTTVAGIQHRLQHTVGQRRRQRPAQIRRRDPLQRQRDSAARDAQ